MLREEVWFRVSVIREKKRRYEKQNEAEQNNNGLVERMKGGE